MSYELEGWIVIVWEIPVRRIVRLAPVEHHQFEDVPVQSEQGCSK